MVRKMNMSSFVKHTNQTGAKFDRFLTQQQRTLFAIGIASCFTHLVVSFAAVIRAVTQRPSPTNGRPLEPCIPFLKLTNKEQASISWKPGSLAANVTRNMIGAAADSYMNVVGSQ